MVRPGGFDLADAYAQDFEIDEIYIHPGCEYPSAYNAYIAYCNNTHERAILVSFCSNTFPQQNYYCI